VLKQRIIKERTHNKHIGEIAAVTPLERKWKFRSYYPAGSSVEAATSPICRTLSVILEAQCDWEAKKTERC